jgi:hypothetical protein
MIYKKCLKGVAEIAAARGDYGLYMMGLRHAAARQGRADKKNGDSSRESPFMDGS